MSHDLRPNSVETMPNDKYLAKEEFKALTPQQLVEWVSQRLPEHICRSELLPLLEAASLSGQDFLELTPEELVQDIKVQVLGHRKALIRLQELVLEDTKGSGSQQGELEQPESQEPASPIQERDSEEPSWRTALATQWEDTAEEFTTWWEGSAGDSKLALLEASRELICQQINDQHPNRLDLFCPELKPNHISRLTSPNLITNLIDIRLNQVEAVRDHDRRFVSSNCGNLPLEDVEVHTNNREMLMTTFLTNILMLASPKHEEAFNKAK
ncbi:hypothetical protein CYMTET_7551 [Cymbomonas tetramitiformis]|uniref:SAM domain-containing protein n=1 Tax=Cymbomonas tetramitiformis TaxID=36881 RepID=A0AAE0GVB0_9CHLO|nr:hypothetical protein CYMTET_7551 [Cymbomonas tetramitiformis]